MIRIFAAGLIGYEAASELLEKHRQELGARFSRRFIREFEHLADNKDPLPSDIQPVLTAQIGEGGLFGTLWQVCEQLETMEDDRFHGTVGLRADLYKVPVKQEVIEICELFGEDPYEAASPGAELILWDDRDMNGSPDAVEHIMNCGTEIGYITNDNRRILYNGEQIRYLTPFERQMKDMVDRQRYY